MLIDGRDIGAIQIADRFSLVELRADVVDRVIEALANATIKGQSVLVRPDNQPGRAGPGPGRPGPRDRGPGGPRGRNFGPRRGSGPDGRPFQ